MWPLIEMMQGYSTLEILFVLAAIGMTLVITIRSTTGYEDEVEAGLAQGHDYATQTENKIHGGHTASGIYGLLSSSSRHASSSRSTTRCARRFSPASAPVDDPTRRPAHRRLDLSGHVRRAQINEIFYELTHTPIMSILLWIRP